MGCGGILNLVIQAIVSLNGKCLSNGTRVYVHPFEGSFLIFSPGQDVAYALDKEKGTTYKLRVSDLSFNNKKNTANVPHNVEAIGEGESPKFSLVDATASFPGVGTFKITVSD